MYYEAELLATFPCRITYNCIVRFAVTYFRNDFGNHACMFTCSLLWWLLSLPPIQAGHMSIIDTNFLLR